MPFKSRRLLGTALVALLLTAGPAPSGSRPAVAAPVESWRLTGTWLTAAEALGPDAFYLPRGIALDLDPFDDQLSVYVVDGGNNRVQAFDAEGGFLRSIGRAGRPETGGLASPRDAAIQGSLLMVTDAGHQRVALFDPQSTAYLGQWPDLAGPWGIAASPDGRIAVVENAASQVAIFQADGRRLATWAGFGEGIGQLNRPRGAVFTADGRLVVADRGNARLVVFDRQGRSVEEAPLAVAPEDLDVDLASRDFLVAHPDGRIRRYRDEVSLPSRPNSDLLLPGLAGLAIGRDASGVTRLFASFADDARPLHGVRRWLGSPPREPAENAEWGDFALPLGRIDAPFRIATAERDLLLADRWPRVQRFDAAGKAQDQVPVGRVGDLAAAADGGLWVVDEDQARLYAVDGGLRSRQVLSPTLGGYSWLVALSTGPSGPAALDVGGQRLVQLGATGVMTPTWRFAPEGATPIALWDLAPAPQGWYLVNRSSDSLERREPISGTLQSAWSVPGRPLRVASNTAGEAFVLNAHGWVLKYAPDGNLLAAWDARGGEPDSQPADLTVDGAGRLLVADAGLDRISIFEPDPEGDPGQTPSFEPVCGALGDKRADPTRLVLGQETEITLELRGSCPAVIPENDVVLVIDHSGSMQGANLAAAKLAARAFVESMDFAHDRVAVIGFNQEALLLAPLADDPTRVRDTVDALVAGGGTDIAEGVDAARIELTGPRRRLSASSVVVLLTDGGSAVAPALRAAAQLQLEGARLFTIGFGAGANTVLLEQMASTPDDYYYAPTPEALEGVYRAIARRITADVLFATLTLRDVLPDNMAYVFGSGAPPPQVAGQVLTWQLADVPLTGALLRYRVRPLETGLHPTNVVAAGEGTDGLGQRGRVDFPVPRVEVLAPTATPSPTPSPTPTPTRGPTPVPRPIYLPLLQRGECLEKQRVDVVLVIDSSDSMLDDVGGGRKKLDLALEAAGGFSELLDLQAGDAVALVHFNGEAAIDLPLSQDPAAVRAALARLPQAPGTRIDLGLELAALALTGPERSPANRPAVILLTDGRPSGTSRQAVVEAGDALRASGAAVYAVGLGRDVDVELLGQLASSPSRLILAPRAEDLARIYTELARDLPCDRP